MKKVLLVFLATFLITACSEPSNDEVIKNGTIEGTTERIELTIDGYSFSKQSSLDVTAISRISSVTKFDSIIFNGISKDNNKGEIWSSPADYISYISTGDTIQITINSNSSVYTFKPVDAEIVNSEFSPILRTETISDDRGNLLNIWIDSEEGDEFLEQELKYNIYLQNSSSKNADSNNYVIDPKIRVGGSTNTSCCSNHYGSCTVPCGQHEGKPHNFK